MKVILIHGLGQSINSWDNVRTYLQFDDVECVNMASLENKRALTYSDLYEELKRICDNTNEEVHLIGMSLGGVLAINYAIDFPEKVRSMVIINSQYRMPKFLLGLQNLIFKIIPEHKFEDTGFSKNDFIEIVRSMKHLDFTDKLQSIKMRALVIGSRKDKINLKAMKNCINYSPIPNLNALKQPVMKLTLIYRRSCRMPSMNFTQINEKDIFRIF